MPLGKQLYRFSAICVVTLSITSCSNGSKNNKETQQSEPTWQQAVFAETNNTGFSDGPHVGTDSAGNAIAIWLAYDGVRSNVWANRFEKDHGWGTPELIETIDTGWAYNPKIAVDPAGNALVVWEQADGTTDIWANRYTLGSGWGLAERIGGDIHSDDDPQIAIDTSGNAIAIWEQSDGIRENVWSSRYTFGVGWEAPETIETDNSGSIDSPQIAFDGYGNAMAVWDQYDGTRTNIWANRYVTGIGWATAEMIEFRDGDARKPQISMDGRGNAIAVWEHQEATLFHIRASRYIANIGWQSDFLIETNDTGNAALPKISMDTDGNAVAIWQQWSNSESTYNICSNRFSPSVGWYTADVIESEPGFSSEPNIAMNDNGEAVVVWEQSDSHYINIWSNRFNPTTGWSSARAIENLDNGSGRYPAISLNSAGIAQAVWKQEDGPDYKIGSNRYE